MSAPDTKALSPAPVSTITRTALSFAKSSMTSAAACDISGETAFRRSGLLNVRVPTPPSLWDSILSLLILSSLQS
jgi:hypothetical protein